MSSEKYELSGLSIIIDIKVDSQDRVYNLNYTLDHYNRYFRSLEILIVEQGEIQKFSLTQKQLKGDNEIIYHFIADNGPHYKTRNLNLATNLTSRPIVMMTDTDVFVAPHSLAKALSMIKKEDYTVLSPHNGVMVEISKAYFTSKTKDEVMNSLVFFPRNFGKSRSDFDFSNMYPIYGGTYFSMGGSIIYTKKAFYRIGGWNTNIISYGYEDMEFVYRAKKLGLKHTTFRKNNIYHLQHQRGVDSRYNNFFRNNEKEWELVCSLNREELKHYVLNGFRRLRLDTKVAYQYVNDPEEFMLSIIPDVKIDLNEVSILIMPDDIEESETHKVDFFLKYLERHFRDYEVIIAENKTNNSNKINHRMGVKYGWCHTKRGHSYGDFLKDMVLQLDRSVVLIWDHYSFIAPNVLQEALDAFVNKPMASHYIEDIGWRAKSIWRVKNKGLGLRLMTKKQLLATLETGTTTTTSLFAD